MAYCLGEHLKRKLTRYHGYTFLSALVTTGAKCFLIPLPLFERDWKMPMLAPTIIPILITIEPTQAEFRQETARAGLTIDELTTPWGEICSVLRPLEKGSR